MLPWSDATLVRTSWSRMGRIGCVTVWPTGVSGVSLSYPRFLLTGVLGLFVTLKLLYSNRVGCGLSCEGRPSTNGVSKLCGTDSVSRSSTGHARLLFAVNCTRCVVQQLISEVYGMSRHSSKGICPIIWISGSPTYSRPRHSAGSALSYFPRPCV